MKNLCLLIMILSLKSLIASEVVVRSPLGEAFVIHVPAEESFAETIDVLQRSFGQKSEYFLDFMAAAPKFTPQNTIERNYYHQVTNDEKNNIAYIVNTLGMAGEFKIIGQKSSLKRVGDSIVHIHPLRFLQTVFTDEMMKASFPAIQGKISWIKDEFFNGLQDSLETESRKNNMKPEFVAEFASIVGIDVNLISPAITAHNWSQLFSLLITHIPRQGNNKRYNM